MSEFGEFVDAQIVPDLRAAMEDALAKETAFIVQAVSIPVVRIGTTVVRSYPGEPPRKDMGALSSHIYFEDVVYGGSGIESAIVAWRPATDFSWPDAAAVLEQGGNSPFGPIEPRPFLGSIHGQPAEPRIAQTCINSIIEHLSK